MTVSTRGQKSLPASADRRLLRRFGIAACAMLAVGVFATWSVAEPDTRQLVIDGETLTTDVAAPEGSSFDRVYSGWRFRNLETQRLQEDDFENPAFSSVELGRELWSKAEGAAGKSCESCHGDAAESMKGVRAQMPKWRAGAGKPQSLEHTINACREGNLRAAPWDWESDEMLAMSAFIGLQSRGMPLNVQTDGPMAPWFEKGKELYNTRFGQLDVACANCHENNFGKRIRADHLSQGMVNGFPTYRFKWQKIGSMHRRFEGCMTNIRATPFKPGGDEFVALELYVASRGKGLSVETPSVRN